MTKRGRGPLDWMMGGRGGELMTSDGVVDESRSTLAKGRLFPSAPDQNQSPVVYTINYEPTPHWRGKTKEQCVPNTWMEDYPANEVEGAQRGEVIIRCPEKEASGSRAAGSGNGRGTTYVNNLLYGPTYVYGGIVGNAGRRRGNGGVDGSLTGSADGTAEYGGGSLTTIHNSPLSAFSGQQLYCSVIPMVLRPGNDRDAPVLGNRLVYDFYPQSGKGHQKKLLPTLIPMNAENIEQLQNGVLWEASEELQHHLKPHNINGNASNIADFNKERLTAVINKNGFNYIRSIGPWLRINVLYQGLLTAFFSKYGRRPKPDPMHEAYASAVKSLESQLALEIQKFYIDEKRRMGRSFGGENKSLALRFNSRMPLDLDNLLALEKTERRDEESGLDAEYHRILRLLRRSLHVMVTLHNQVVADMKSMWMGTVTSPVAQPGTQVKFVSRA